MKKAPTEIQLAEPQHEPQVFRDGEMVLLSIDLCWPRLLGDGAGVRRINRYYTAFAERWKTRWTGPMLAEAKAAAGPETEPWEARLQFTVTKFTDGVLSLYLDAVEKRGGRPLRVRQGDTWRLPSGVPVLLREVLKPQRWWRGSVLEEIRRDIGRRVDTGESIFYEDWVRLASRHFSPDRFYLTEAGPMVFYPECSLAPALEGFPTFSLARLTPETES